MRSKNCRVISFLVISVCILLLTGSDANVLKDLQAQFFPYTSSSSTARPTFYGITQTQTPYYGRVYPGENLRTQDHHTYPYGVHQPVSPYNYGARPSFYPSVSVLPPNSIFNTGTLPGRSFHSEQPVTGLPPLPKQTHGTDGREDAMLLHYSAGDLLKYILSFGISQYLPARESSYNQQHPEQQQQKTQDYLQKISKMKEKESSHGWFWRRRRDAAAISPARKRYSPPKNDTNKQRPGISSPARTSRKKRSTYNYNPYAGGEYRGDLLSNLAGIGATESSALSDHAPYFDPNEQLHRQRILAQQIYPTLSPAWRPIGGYVNVKPVEKPPAITGPSFGWMDPKIPAATDVASGKSSFGWVNPKLDIPDRTTPHSLEDSLQQMRLMLPNILVQ